MRLEKSRQYILECTYYNKSFVFLFFLFAGVYFFLHPYIAHWDDYIHIRKILSYPSERSSYQGLIFGHRDGVSNFAPVCAVDGVVILENGQTVELKRDISLELPCRFTIRIKSSNETSFRIYFTETQKEKYYFKYNINCPNECGVYSESERMPVKHIEFVKIEQSERANSDLNIEIICRKESFDVNIGRVCLEFETKAPVQKSLLKIDSLPNGMTLLDMVKVEEILPDGSTRTVAAGDFHITPLFLDLPLSLGMNVNSRILRLLAFALLAIVALLFDNLLAMGLRSRSLSSMPLYEMLFLLLPFQGVILFILRAFLSIPFSCALLCILMVFMAKFIQMLRWGYTSSVFLEHQKARLSHPSIPSQ